MFDFTPIIEGFKSSVYGNIIGTISLIVGVVSLGVSIYSIHLVSKIQKDVDKIKRDNTLDVVYQSKKQELLESIKINGDMTFSDLRSVLNTINIFIEFKVSSFEPNEQEEIDGIKKQVEKMIVKDGRSMIDRVSDDPECFIMLSEISSKLFYYINRE